MEVFMVRYANYDPPEVDSLWTTAEEAQKRADELDEQYKDAAGWKVTARTVYEKWEPSK